MNVMDLIKDCQIPSNMKSSLVIHILYMKIEKKLENKPRFFEEYKKDQELTFPADHLIGCNCNIKIICVTQQ